MAECREKAQTRLSEGQPSNWIAAGAILAVWLFLAALTIISLFKLFQS
jgi:hypothetical protein